MMKTGILASLMHLSLCVGLCEAAPLKAPAHLMLENALPLSFGAKAAVPRGYYELCRSKHPVCTVVSARGLRTTRRGAVIISDDLLRQIAKANADVNRRMRGRSDYAQFGVKDRWVVGGVEGDCEDFALTKKKILLDAGWPSGSLLIALGKTSSGEEHAVLIVRTDKGDLILDNLTNKVRGWNRTPLSLRSVQSPTDLWAWHSL